MTKPFVVESVRFWGSELRWTSWEEGYFEKGDDGVQVDASQWRVPLNSNWKSQGVIMNSEDMFSPGCRLARCVLDHVQRREEVGRSSSAQLRCLAAWLELK